MTYHTKRWPLVLVACLGLAKAATHEIVTGSFATQQLYTLQFDDVALTLDLIANNTTPAQNSWIALSHDKQKLYGTNYTFYTRDANNRNPPGFFSYSISNSGKTITHDSTVYASDKCNGTSVFIVANDRPPYQVMGSDLWAQPGCSMAMSVDGDGSLKGLLQDNQYWQNSSIHGGVFSIGSRFYYAADTYGDAIWTHPVDRRTGKLGKPISVIPGPVPGVPDPRHLAIHPTGKVLYGIMEYSSLITSYTLNSLTGIPTPVKETYSLLPQGTNVTRYWADEVIVSPSGKYLWATTRGRRDTGLKGYISVFELGATGKIVKQNFLIETTTSGGIANAISPMPFSDRFIALTDNELGFVEIWELARDRTSAKAVARRDIVEPNPGRFTSGCCTNPVWLS